MKIADLFFGFRGDSTQLTADAQKAAGEAATAGAKTFTSKFAAGIKVGAVLVAGAFALMAKGAMQMEDAQSEFIRLTGKSREEAVAFSKDMNDLMGSTGAVGKSFEDVYKTGAMIEQQFGTSGQATKDLTELVLEFSKVTKQDAAPAAADLEDTLSAYGLTAADAAGFTDMLVASAHKYGTQVGPAQLATLRSMAPALQAMGAGIDDSIGLLNMFEVAGIDAATAQRGLNTAITKLPPGTTLDDFVKHLSDLKRQGIDPTAEAIKVFGNRAGPALALAIQPGMDSLSDLVVSAEDAAGAVADTANDMLTAGNKFKQFGDTISKALRGIGSDFGPLISGLGGISVLMAGFGGTIKKALGGLLSVSLIKTAAEKVGIYLGATVGTAWLGAQALAVSGVGAVKALFAPIAAMAIPLAPAGYTVGTAVGAAMVAGATFGIGALLTIGWLNAVAEAKHNIQENPNSITPTDMFQMRAPMWAGAKLAVAKEMQNLGQGALDAFNAEWDKGIAAGLSTTAALAPAKAAGLAIGGAAAQGAVMGIDNLKSSFGALGGIVADAGAAVVPVAESAGADVGHALATGSTDEFISYWNSTAKPLFTSAGVQAGIVTTQGIARGILDNKTSARDSWKAYLEEMKHPFDAMAEIAWIQGKLAGKKLSDGINSSDPLVRQAAQDEYDILNKRLSDLGALGYDTGTALGNQTAKGVTDSTPKAVTAAQNLANKINAELAKINTNIHIYANAPDIAHGGGPGRAAGGPFPAFQSMLVGERGPERVVFDRPGYVIPNNQIGNTSPSVTVGDINVTVNGGATNAATGQSVAQAVRKVLSDVLDAYTPGMARYTSDVRAG